MIWRVGTKQLGMGRVKLFWNEAQAAASLIVYCTAASTSLSDSVHYLTFLFSEWRACLTFTVITFRLYSAQTLFKKVVKSRI